MARKRSISKQISISEQVDQLSDQAALLFTWMIPHCDDFGRLPDSVKKLAAMVIPLRRGKPGWSYEDIEKYLVEMEHAVDEAGVPLIIRYMGEDGTKVIQLPKFDQHQDGLHKRTKSQFPEPPQTFWEVPGNSGKFPLEQKRTEQKRKEEEAEEEEKDPIGLATSVPNSAAAAQAYRLIEGEFGRPLSPLEAEEVFKLCEEFGYELLREATKRAVAQGKRSLRYIRRILENWRSANLRTLTEVQQYEELREREIAAKKAAPNGSGTSPPDAASLLEAQKKKREEKINAAVTFIRLKYQGRLPPRAEAEKIAQGYGQDVAPEIISRLYNQNDEGGPAP
jgi:DnaD/phage-associated family protein